MKLVSTFALAAFLATNNNHHHVEAFGPAAPLRATSAFSSSSSKTSVTNTGNGASSMTMRIGQKDMKRKQRLVSIIDANPTKEIVENELLSDETSEMIQKCSWKLRKVLIRKVKNQAERYEIPVDSSFGVPPTQTERESKEMAEGAQRKADKTAAVAAAQAVVQERKESRMKKRAESKAKAAEFAAKLQSKKPAPAAPAPAPAAKVEAPAPAAKVEEPAPKAEAPAPAAPAPAPAASGGGGGAVTPKTIKELRDATGAGMMDCKKALLETDGDQEAAAEYLRKKGLAKADKKASRVAAEGKIAVANQNGKAVMVEVNCETDFVGKDASFLGFSDKVASAALGVDGDSVESLMSQEVDGESLESARQALVAKIGENIQVRRMSSRGGGGNTVGGYVHMNSIGVLVELEGGDEQLCTDIAMHVTAMNPPFATADDVPQEVLEKEKNILSGQALESGKPPEIVEKMVEGRIRKYLEEICLVSQAYVKDGDKTVGQLLEEKGAKMVGFTRLAVGEGIEKKEDDFAAEVAKMAGTPAPAPAPEPEPEPVKEEPKAEAPAPAKASGGAVTPKTIKELRDATGAGMMDCKKALLETDGDQEAAAEYLRKKGLAKADKKASRVAAEGKIAIANSGNKAVMVEVNCETDFVAKDDNFLGFCDKVAGSAVNVASDSVEDLMNQDGLEETRQAMVAKIGENIQVRRMASRGSEGTTVGAYVHMNKLGVLVEIEGGSEQLCIDVAMHIAAMNPPFATADDVPQAVLEKEKKILSEQALESGKPPEIVEKMVEGRIRKYLEDICLVSQTYVKDGDKTVGKLLEENGAKMIGFTRLAVGEGIEKKEDDFAAEVAKMAGTKEPATVSN